MSRLALAAAAGLLFGLGACSAGDESSLGAGGGSPPAGSRGSGSPADEAPLVIESVRLEPREPAQGSTVRGMAVVRGASPGSFELDYRWFVDGVPLRIDAPTLSLEGVRKGAQVRVQVTATNGTRTSEPAEASATVIDRMPTLTMVSLVPAREVAPGQPVSARAMAADPDGDPIEYEYRWYVNGRPVEAGGSLFQTDGLSQGDAITAEIRAGDGAQWTRAERTEPVLIGSAHPEIISTPPGFRDDGAFRYAIEARDPDGDRLRFSLLEGPEGMAIDEVLGELLWRPGDDQEGTHPVKVEVRDSSGLATTQGFTVTVRREEGTPNDAGASR